MLNTNTTINKFHLKAIIASFLICFLSWTALIGQGFLAGTLVKTSSGYMPIEQLHIDDKVICYDFEASCIERPVTCVIKKHTDDLIAIRIGGEFIYLAPDHQLYLPITQEWVEARAARPGDVLLRHCTEHALIEDVCLLQQAAEVYDITVAEYHNFCVSQQDIHVHNFVIEAVVVWTFGEGFTYIFGVSLLGLGAKLFFDEAHERHMRSKLEFDSDAFGQRLQDAYHAQNNNDAGWNNNNDNRPPNNKGPQQGPEDPDPNNPKKKSGNKGPSPEDAAGLMGFAKKRGQEQEETASEINNTNKNVKDLLSGSKFEKTTKGNTKIYAKNGSFNDALHDFDSLNPQDIRNIPDGKVGKLNNGHAVNVRSKSTDGRVTLELFDGGKSIKVRYQ